MPNDPIFLNLDDVLQIHQDTILIEGGSDGVRDIALIDSAVAALVFRAANGEESFPPAQDLEEAALGHGWK